ncbi:DMT family transporter [Halobacterium sp. KA-6]|uniref:DMT family transporter n=1 Tax=Halobacterium sp. KA-6 TaxID=2896368 RepID=UPI001E37CD4B|nr:EamA family transporter [Halobacterium sp. KA-6]MCD2204591.1 EamA family transporter [Halobacterium sp. KA-6]
MLRRHIHALAPLGASALWGGMYVVAKWGLSVVPPVTLSFLRVALAAIVLLALVRATKPSRTFTRGEWWRFTGLGAAIAVTLATQFLGTELTNASQSSLLTVMVPVFILLLGVTVLDETVTQTKVVGLVITLFGTMLVLSGQYDFSMLTDANLAGIGALFTASLAWAIYTVWGRDLVRRYSALETATYATVISVPMLFGMAIIELWIRGPVIDEAVISLPFLLGLVYLSVFATAISWYLWYKGLEYVDSSIVAMFFFVQPVVGSALGAIFLREDLGPLFFAGGLVMTVGLYIVSVRMEV